jgi:hypothetical protein
MEEQKGPNVSPQSEPAPEKDRKTPMTGAQRQAKHKTKKKWQSYEFGSNVNVSKKDAS